MNQIDWVGSAAATAAKPFKDIHNQRPSVAEEKARLCLELGSLINKVPARVRQGGVETTREWKAAREAAAKIAANSRSTVHQLTSAINNMRRYS